ncbi:MAG: Ribosomal RNA large subunit methyltransferase I [Chloroflexi bacterium]|nr:Ribosomal RNA large subunit methyltransferase I [Chloroflexota bacterium]
MHSQLHQALDAREHLINDDHTAAFRLFSGFYEGRPDVVADVYARTLLLWGYGEDVETMAETLRDIQQFYLEQLPWINCVVQKFRSAQKRSWQRGIVTYGETPAQKVNEHGLCYAVDLTMNQDASFYLDTRHLRRWLIDHAGGWSVFNAFAYTGSLGVAALGGGASRVVQGDRNRDFLALGRTSGMLSHLDIGKMKLKAADFFQQVAQFKGVGRTFDCVIVDPPFFSTTGSGTVDLVNESVRVINKVRPLIKGGGYLVTINNALFLSGAEYMRSLEGLCADGYLTIEELISVPQDVTGYPSTIVNQPPTDPAPFDHPTKIVVLGVRKK